MVRNYASCWTTLGRPFKPQCKLLCEITATARGIQYVNMPQLSSTEVEYLRHWRAQLTLGLELRGDKTTLVNNQHLGPLRVQRPFYPEARDCCHVYILHPPGGMVVGDLLQISVRLGKGANALLTTPSAGKIYSVQRAPTAQRQVIEVQVEEGACVEWLPQETIAFSGANGRLNTRLKLRGDAQACFWDIVCLGRPAAGEAFSDGRCDQDLEVWRDDHLLLLERNRFIGGAPLLQAPWGMNGRHTCATMIATVQPSRDQVDTLLQQLNQMMPTEGAHDWGLTQKGELFIARYIGHSSLYARRGLQWIWHRLRPLLNDSAAVEPRIWNT